MTVFQKTIKYSEMSFAVFLIVYIISGICYGIGSVSFLRNSLYAVYDKIKPRNVRFALSGFDCRRLYTALSF